MANIDFIIAFKSLVMAISDRAGIDRIIVALLLLLFLFFVMFIYVFVRDVVCEECKNDKKNK